MAEKIGELMKIFSKDEVKINPFCDENSYEFLFRKFIQDHLQKEKNNTFGIYKIDKQIGGIGEESVFQMSGDHLMMVGRFFTKEEKITLLNGGETTIPEGSFRGSVLSGSKFDTKHFALTTTKITQVKDASVEVVLTDEGYQKIVATGIKAIKEANPENKEKIGFVIATILLSYKQKYGKDFVFDTKEKKVKPFIGKNFKDLVPTEKDIEEMLSKVDFNRFVTMMSIGANKGSKYANRDICKQIIRDWAIAKYPFYVMLNRELSISVEKEYPMDLTEFSGLFTSFLDSYPVLRSMFSDYSPSDAFQNKVGAIGDKGNECPISMLKDASRDMKVTTAVKTITSIDADAVIENIRKNMGGEIPSDVKKHIVAGLNRENDRVLNELSEIYQNKTVKGFFTISIDPYDYLTVSTNCNGWDSCATMNSGAYSTTGYSLMLDKTTLVSYKHNGKESLFSSGCSAKRKVAFGKYSFSGNSKAWRMLVYYDLNTSSFFIPTSQYAAVNSDFTTIIKDLLKNNQETHYKDIKYNAWSAPEDFLKDNLLTTSFSYHDALNSSQGLRGGIFYTPIGLQTPPKMRIGVEQIACPNCGNKIDHKKDDKTTTSCRNC